MVTETKKWDLSFNSIKVRLKHSDIGLALNIQSFQFHKGTIKTMLSLLSLKASIVSIP